MCYYIRVKRKQKVITKTERGIYYEHRTIRRN